MGRLWNSRGSELFAHHAERSFSIGYFRWRSVRLLDQSFRSDGAPVESQSMQEAEWMFVAPFSCRAQKPHRSCISLKRNLLHGFAVPMFSKMIEGAFSQSRL